ncbi:MAG: hypothetical protein U0234_25980 [Sandaracinus sp.]
MTLAHARALALVCTLAALSALSSGCDCAGPVAPRTGGDGSMPSGDAGPTITGLDSFTITPLDATIEVRDGVAATQTFTAMGHFHDGSTRDVSSIVLWGLAAPHFLGRFNANVFTSGTTSGGVGQVSARANGMVVTTTLTVRFVATHSVPPTGAGAPIPAMPGTLFGGSADASRAPELVYPNDGVLLPPNLGRVEIHWRVGSPANTLFEIGFSNDVTDVRFYTRCERPAGVADGGCIYEPSGGDWTSIAETNRGQTPVTVTVRATDDTGSGVGTSDTIDVRFSRDALMGTLYYWAASSTSIQRYDFGAASGMAMPVITPAQAGGTCVGCHAVSRDGTRIVASVGGQNAGGIELYDLTTYTALRSDPNSHVIQFGSFSPDGSQLVGCYGDDGAPSDRGLLFFDTRCDAANMASCGQIVDTLSIEGREVTHPSWSPDGLHIAYTDVDGNTTSQRPRHGAIGMVDRSAGAWSAPHFLVPRGDGVSYINPDWAPDGTFLALTRSTCPGGNLDDRDCNGDSDPSSVVMAVPSTGSAAPVELTSAMAPGVADAGRTELNNTFARFAPFEFVLSDGDAGTARLMWVSFASTRAYGLRNPPGGNDESGRRGTYLWMSGVRPEAVSAGRDPSFAAFALPFQDLTTSNHIAVWTTQSVGMPMVD